MKRPIFSVCLFLLAIVCIQGVTGIEWPVEKRLLTATFGENRKDHFHGGIDIGGGEQEVRPIADGEVLFTFEEGEYLDTLPCGLGSFIVIEHEKELRSVYAHLKPGSVATGKETVKQSDVIGIIGDSGSSNGTHLHLALIDREFDQVVNPLLILPPIPDKRFPEVRSVQLKEGQAFIDVYNGITVPPGHAEVILDVRDPAENTRVYVPMAPFKVAGYANGEELFQVNYEALQEKDGVLVLEKTGGKAFSQYYEGEWKIKPGSVQLNPGDVRLEISVQDFAGNEVNRMYLLKVREVAR
ncbi:MAG TPA: M23 family metallopeptidase [Spirochaetia bacterium]|nr:M23 family metallopeptidase [Spirochaetia bacterium]